MTPLAPPFRSPLLFAALSLLFTAVLHAEPVVALLAATETELRPILAQLSDVRSDTRAAWTVWTGTLGGRRFALTRTEGDPLNTVAAVTLALRRHPAPLVVTFGPSRAHDPALRAGDVVVSSKFAAFDGMISPQRELGAGSDPLQWAKLRHLMMNAGEKETPMEFFPADQRALAVARGLTPRRGRIVTGVLGSANQVNREADRVAWIRQHWGTACEDGESAHAAGCALLFGVPSLGLRVIEGTEGEAALLVLKFLEEWK